MSERLNHRPMLWRAAKAFVQEHHRHHEPPTGHLFSIAAVRDGQVRGVVIVGRPTPKAFQDGVSCEVTRLCVLDGEPSVIGRDGTEHQPAICSFLYNCAKRAAMALGYHRIGTYTLKREPGTSLVAARWVPIAEVRGRSWDTPTRRRNDRHPTDDKIFWAPADVAELYPRDAAA
jgi:hypothetical protein